ncbi:MAG: 4'-phosphopantetheinyl transferase superfamily protein [Flavicella sp.]|nr:4'-phosphopantetheinyl transferase superfamily protein [Flavicella sp.]
MPFIKTIPVDKHTTVFLWKISEPLDELMRIPLIDSSLQRISHMRSEVHKKGFVSIRHLLKHAGYSDSDLYYSATGKPHLKDGKHISITHSFDYAAIAIGSNAVGIDIEKNREKIKRIAPKFLGTEMRFVNSTSSADVLTVLWGAKEALFKCSFLEGLSFKKHISINPFELKDRQTGGCIKTDTAKETYQIFFEPIEEFTLVYAVPTTS